MDRPLVFKRRPILFGRPAHQTGDSYIEGARDAWESIVALDPGGATQLDVGEQERLEVVLKRLIKHSQDILDSMGG